MVAYITHTCLSLSIPIEITSLSAFLSPDLLYVSLAVGAILLLFGAAAALAVIRRRRTKNADEEHAAASILVYPSQQGTAPQFL